MFCLFINSSLMIIFLPWQNKDLYDLRALDLVMVFLQNTSWIVQVMSIGPIGL